MDMTRLLGNATLAFGLILSGCESTGTGPDLESAAGDRQTQVLLSSSSSPTVSTALLSLAAQGNSGKNGPIDLGTIDQIRVQITGVSVLLADGAASEDDDLDLESESSKWLELELEHDPTTPFNLIDLGTIELASVPWEVEGELEAIRFYFGDASVVFDGGAEEDLFIPSGKVTIPASGLAVTLDDDVLVRFASGASVKKIIRTGRGLLMPPVFEVGNRDDDDDDDDKADDGEDTDDAEEGDLDDDPNDKDDAGDDDHADAGDDAEGGEAGDDGSDDAAEGDDEEAGSDDDDAGSDEEDDDSDTSDEGGAVGDDDEEETLEEE